MTGQFGRPRAITMWDYSWIERRWGGGGYEDWDKAIGELADRGYDAVRIDAFPHFIAKDRDRRWTSIPCGQDGDWGAKTPVEIEPAAGLVDFMRRCRDRGVAVGLSTWFKQDPEDVRMEIRTPEDHGRIWVETLRLIEEASLLDAIYYVDLCNEFPNLHWAPFAYPPGTTQADPLAGARMKDWMTRAIATVREHYPDLPYTFSFSSQFKTWEDQDVSMLDFIEPHIWMSLPEIGSFYSELGYDSRNKRGFEGFLANAPDHYRANTARHDAVLAEWIRRAADWSRKTDRPLITTECWGPIHWRNLPGLDWGWIKELGEFGVRTACVEGRWVSMATSNFCGPQYPDMWADVDWHQRMTQIIRGAPVDEAIAGA